VTLYLDTSSLVKLYIEESGNERVWEQVELATSVATSAVAYPEARAALARRRRDHTLSAVGFAAVKRVFDAEWTRYVVVEVTDTLCKDASQLAEQYALRGYDSIHLASFLEIARQAGVPDTEFSSFDDRLNAAARRAARALSRSTSRRS
jgi:predicted nucleic acid-binding protein